VHLVRKCRLKVIGCRSTRLYLTILLCHFRKRKSWESPDWPSRLVPLIWHPVVSSYPATWRKNSMGRISSLKTRWSLCSERFDQNSCLNALTSSRRMDREITRVYCEWGVHPSQYPSFDMLHLLVREIGSIGTTSGLPETISCPVIGWRSCATNPVRSVDSQSRR
jgi:hypothetical protein